jgi:hypothetical protein
MFNRVEFMIEQPTDTYEPVACPAPLLPFPAGIDEGGDFVCFDPPASQDDRPTSMSGGRGWQVDMPTQ